MVHNFSKGSENIMQNNENALSKQYLESRAVPDCLQSFDFFNRQPRMSSIPVPKKRCVAVPSTLFHLPIKPVENSTRLFRLASAIARNYYSRYLLL